LKIRSFLEIYPKLLFSHSIMLTSYRNNFRNPNSLRGRRAIN